MILKSRFSFKGRRDYFLVARIHLINQIVIYYSKKFEALIDWKNNGSFV